MAHYTIGVLALQGAYALHESHVVAAGARYREVRHAAQLAECDGLILPGGESGTLLKLLDLQGLMEPLQRFCRKKPVWGICAGVILLAEQVENPQQRSLGVAPISVMRNGYGRQVESCEEMVDGYRVSYIRAPLITRVGDGASVLSKRNDQPTWVEAAHIMLTTFHPELNRSCPSPWHLRLVRNL